VVVRPSSFGENGFEEVRLSYVDLANHPACTATLPNIFFDLFGPPSPLRAYKAHVAKSCVRILSPKRVSKHVPDVWHQDIDLLLLWRQQVSPSDDEADFCNAIIGHPSLVLCSSILGSEFGYTQGRLEIWDNGQGEIGSVNDVVDVVTAVGRLCDGLLYGVDSRVMYGRSYAVMEKVVASVTYGRGRCLDMFW
jgi:hypothetical protein